MRYVAFTLNSPTDISDMVKAFGLGVYSIVSKWTDLNLYWNFKIFGCFIMSPTKQLYHIWLLKTEKGKETS